MSANNFSGYGGGVSAISSGPLICTMTAPYAITNNSTFVIAWNHVQNSAPWMNYNPTNGIFTASFPGVYIVQWFFSCSNVTSMGNVFVTQLMNGSGIGASNLWGLGYVNPSNNQIIFSHVDTYELAEGDTLQYTVNGMQGNIIDGIPTATRAHVMLVQGGS